MTKQELCEKVVDSDSAVLITLQNNDIKFLLTENIKLGDLLLIQKVVDRNVRNELIAKGL